MDIIGVGESDIDILISVENIAGKGEKTRGTEIGKFPGGIVGNFCSAAAKLGMDCGIVSMLGDDENGEIAFKDYENRDIDISNLIIQKKEKTFYCVVFIDPTGEKYLTAVVTPLISPNKNKIDFAYLKQAEYVHTTSMDYNLVEKIVDELKLTNTKISMDFEAHAEKKGLNNWKYILKNTNTLFINEGGMKTLFYNNHVDTSVQKLLSLGINHVVYTKGANGGTVYTKNKKFNYDAYHVNEVKDTTGAGDCFNATFLSYLIQGHSMEEVIQHAAASAAISIQHMGARTGLPTKEEVEQFIKNNS